MGYLGNHLGCVRYAPRGGSTATDKVGFDHNSWIWSSIRQAVLITCHCRVRKWGEKRKATAPVEF